MSWWVFMRSDSGGFGAGRRGVLMVCGDWDSFEAGPQSPSGVEGTFPGVWLDVG